MSTVKRLMELFRGHSGVHGTHGEPERDTNGVKWAIKSTARTLREPVTEALWEEHVAGRRPLGVVPIDEQNLCRWGSIDVDQYDVDLLAIIRKVESARLPLVPCRSKSGGLHLFLFLLEPQSAVSVQSVLKDVAARIGLSGSEIFPKQTQVITERGDLGNWMVMPYYGGTFNGKLREQVGLKRTGGEMTVGEFLAAAEGSRLSPDNFANLGGRGRAPAASRFSDGPPCLQHLALGGFPDGGRNNSLFMIGLYLKRRSPATWHVDLEEYNRELMKPPLPSDEVSLVVRSLEKKEYEYTCKNEPMASHCDVAVCRGRRFGVGGGGDYPVISSISKLDTEPPVWFVDVEGHRVVATTDQFLNFNLFQKLCFEKMNKVFRNMKQGDWTRLLAQPMGNLTIIEAPVDVGDPEQFREHLEEFLTNRTKGERREDLLLGRPWEDEREARYYFRLSFLQKFLAREGLRDVKRHEITRRIQALGGDHSFFNIKGRGVNVWWVPSRVVQPPLEQDAPAIQGPPI